MSGARVDVVGREAELERLKTLVGIPGSRSVVIEGEAGIGKTTLWQETIDASAARGYAILIARASSSEAGMGFAVLTDLLGDCLPNVLDELPDPQAEALEVACLRRAGGKSAEPLATSAACLGALRALARRGPLLVAVDDVQWLDRATAAALEFAFRRLEDESVHLAATLRTGSGGAAGTHMIDAIPPERVERISVGPLCLHELHRLISQHIGAVLPRPVLRRIEQTSGGNPFFALELARTVVAPGNSPSLAALHLSSRLEDLVRARLHRLPMRVLRVLEPAALVADPTLQLLRSLAAAPGKADADVERAVIAGIVQIENDFVRFTHPTLGEGLAAMMGPLRRRSLHARLAASIDEPEERARHLAAATTIPDADVACQVEDGATSAGSHGATASRAELLEQAARLTPPNLPEERSRRMTEAAAAFEIIGMTGRARSLIDDCLRQPITGVTRADALVVRSHIRWDDLALAEDSLAEAAAEAGADDRRLSAILCSRAPAHLVRTCDIPGALVFARSAADAATRACDDRLQVAALAFVSLLENFGGPITKGLLESALDLERRQGAPLFYWESPTFVMAHRLFMADRLDEARVLFEGSVRRCEEAGEDNWWEATTAVLAELEARAGNFERAGRLADETWARRQQRGEEVQGGAALYRKALVMAHIGSPDEARALIEHGIEISIGAGDELFRTRLLALLGFLELSLGDPAAADAALRALPRWLIEHGWNEPSYVPAWPNAVEALIGVGDLAEASECLRLFDERARLRDCPWALASARRCEGLLRSAQGDVEGAVSAFDQALSEHTRVPSRFELGRTLLSQGVVLRRALRRREARKALDQALRIFTEVRTFVWVDRARAELARIGGRSSAGEGLTTTERRVADLVARGKTNREVAAELFVAVRSVESNLSKIYAKLGVRSRSELAHVLSSPHPVRRT